MKTASLVTSLALAAVAVLGVAGPASAHDQLLSTSPADGTTVTTLPHEVTLTFSDVVLAGGGDANQVEVLDASCTPLGHGPAQVQDNVVTQAISGSSTGPVHVLWRVVSRDGHPVSGAFTFTVGEGAAPAPSASCDVPTSAAEAGQNETPSPMPWVVGGAIVVIVIAGVVYLLATRSRRTDQ